MIRRVLSVRSCLGSDQRGFFLGTFSLTLVILLMYAGGVQASLSVGPGGDFPTLKDVLLYAFSHDETPSLLVSVALLLSVGPCQERRWGTVAFLALSLLTAVILLVVYTLVLFVLGGEASRICGSSGVQLALITAQCGQVTHRRLLRCLPFWLLPWTLLLLFLLLLPGTPALLHVCAIAIGHNYHQSFIGVLQELEVARVFSLIPRSAYVTTSSRLRLPTHSASPRSFSNVVPVNQASPPDVEDASSLSPHSSGESAPVWIRQESAALSEVDVLEEQMLTAGILASLQDAPEDVGAKVEVPKTSVSSLRLQQLERMGFPTEKAVVALAASKQLDGAISLLIDDSIGEQAVVVAKGKSPRSAQGSSATSLR